MNLPELSIRRHVFAFMLNAVLILFGSAMYLTAWREVRVRGVYYGAWEARNGDEAPLLDLGPLLALAERAETLGSE